MEEMIADMVLSIIKSFIKNPTSAAKYKAVLIEIRDSINDVFPGS